MSDCTLQDANSSASGLGLSFRQFVDALVRCGLIGFSAERAAAGGGDARGPSLGEGESVRDGGGYGSGALRQSASEQLFVVPVAQRAHAIFIRQMKLLDGQHVDAKVMRLMPLHPAPTANDEEGEKNTGKTTTKAEGKNGGRGKTKATGRGLQKTRVVTTNHTPGRLRGGGWKVVPRAVAADPPKSISLLTPIFHAITTTTTRDAKKPYS